MKYLKRIFENNIPIDVESDIEKYLKKFPHKISSRDRERLNKLIDDNPTMTDDYDFYKIIYDDLYKIITYCKAVNKEHALIVATINQNSKWPDDYFTDGSYEADETSIEEVKQYIKVNKIKINHLQKEVDYLENLLKE